jgi:hypothetical protein
MANTANKVINVAAKEVGYLEKKTNAWLGSKTKNAGSNNYTKYGKWFGMNGVYWCAICISWIFNKAFGKTKAKELLCGGFSASCETLRQQFIKAKKYVDGKKTPKKGYVIFFSGTRHSGANHIGIVTKVVEVKVHTIEGNTSGGSSVVDNGGGVVYKSYNVGYDKILGYGIPAYDKETTTTTTTATKLTAPRPTLKMGVVGASVKTLQKCLNKANKTNLSVDGIYGKNTYNAVIKFQKSKNIVADGIYGKGTYKKLKAVIK